MKNTMDYEIVQVGREGQSFMAFYKLDGVLYHADLNDDKMLLWLLEAAFRTRLDEAMREKRTKLAKSEAAHEQAKRINKGIIGRACDKEVEAQKLRDDLTARGLSEHAIETAVTALMANIQ